MKVEKSAADGARSGVLENLDNCFPQKSALFACGNAHK